MKPIHLLILSAFILSAGAYADSKKYRNDINPKRYNSVWEKQFETASRLDYDPEKKTFDFYVKESLFLSGFTMTRENADQLIKAIEKYEEWNKKAIEKEVTLEKDISEISLKDIFWQSGDDWRFSGKTQTTASFFSQSKTRHQFILMFPKVTDKYNKYSDHKPDIIYFDFAEAVKFKEALKEESIKAFLKKTEEQAKIDAEFN